MALFWVNQGRTYQQEREGGYVWSPQVSRRGGKVRGFSNMCDIHRGDYIFHNSKASIQAVSIAKTDCYDANQPRELLDAGGKNDWNQEGYRVDLEYHDLDTSVPMAPFRLWLMEHHVEKSAFDRRGQSHQQYMSHLNEMQAQYLLQHVIKQQRTEEVRTFLRRVLP